MRLIRQRNQENVKFVKSEDRTKHSQSTRRPTKSLYSKFWWLCDKLHVERQISLEHTKNEGCNPK